MAGIVLTNPATIKLPKLDPILKWPGGKRWLAEVLADALGLSSQHSIVEPFVGGGALSFYARPERALLGDVNAELIACYKAIRDTPTAVSCGLRQLTINSDTFSEMVAKIPMTDVEKAVRLIYLNRTAFGGIWRVNRSGKFNVPFGCKPETKLPDSASIARTSEALQSASLYAGDFAIGLSAVDESDLVYCDPPYTVAHNNNGFIRYNERIFSWADQYRLSESAQALAGMSRRVVISNAAHSDVLKLYPRNFFARVIVSRKSNLAADPRYRGTRQEALIVSKALVRSNKKLRDALGDRGLNVEVG